ncbi:NIPSNAP family protein [Acidimangrovimonas sediminis]|uniref:NIPSNAP family protein n=1 Tax=Acidimangrovimonas sediminis TaxID=2056283 RepID=UPI000C80D3C6|nr:NIPSNAP family protein [Acidimangrovimonas sediminis]
MLYDITTLSIRLGTAAEVNKGVEAFTASDAAKGRLLGCWHTEIGALNRCLILRGYEDFAALEAERGRILDTVDPFGCGDAITEMSFDSYKPFPFLPEVTPGSYGTTYEIRTYRLKHGGVPKTIEAWKAAMPERSKLSPLSIAMYALDGAPRFTHIWPYQGLDHRAKVRGDSVAQGVWPPKGGPAWLTGEMASQIGLPTAFSPLA